MQVSIKLMDVHIVGFIQSERHAAAGEIASYLRKIYRRVFHVTEVELLLKWHERIGVIAPFGDLFVITDVGERMLTEVKQQCAERKSPKHHRFILTC